MTIWGNHSATQYPDLHHALISNAPVTDDLDMDWYASDFIPTVQQRGAAIIEARASSAASAANAAIDHMRSWALGSPDNDWVSMGVISDGAYGIEPGLIYRSPSLLGRRMGNRRGSRYLCVQPGKNGCDGAGTDRRT